MKSTNYMGLFSNKKKAEEFDYPIELENAWAWDSEFWNLMSANSVPNLSQDNLELARKSIIKKLDRIKRILEHGVEKSDDEIMLESLPMLKKLLHPLKLWKVMGEPLALRSEENMRGVRHKLRYFLVQVTETQFKRKWETEGIPEYLLGDDIQGFREHFAKIWL